MAESDLTKPTVGSRIPEPSSVIDDAVVTHPRERTSSSGGAAILGVVSIILALLWFALWTPPRGDTDEYAQRSRAVSFAAEWARLLIAMNPDDFNPRLWLARRGEFDRTGVDSDSVRPSASETGQLPPVNRAGRAEPTALELVDLDIEGDPIIWISATLKSSRRRGRIRIDVIQVIATTISVGFRPRTVQWKLLLDVSDVDGALLISRIRVI